MAGHFNLPQTAGRTVAVLQGGETGWRIASSWALGGFDVVVYEAEDTQRTDALEYCKNRIGARKKLPALKKSSGEVKTAKKLEEAIESAWLVIEASTSHKDQNAVDLFAQIERAAPKDAILATNSPIFLVGELSSEEARRRSLNLRYEINPEAGIVELMSSGSTDSGVMELIFGKLQDCAINPVVVSQESRGLTFDRIWGSIKREVLSIVAEGVTDAATVDYVWKKATGLSWGPAEMMDTEGIDNVSLQEKLFAKDRNLPQDKTVDFLEQNYISRGKLGKKSQKGGFHPRLGLPNGSTKSDEPTLYFLDIGLLALEDPVHGGKIIAGRADGTASTIVVDKQAFPDGIDIDEGRLFWSNMGIPPENDGSVQSCKMDGSDIKYVIAKSDIHTPKQVILDKKNKKLYVCDREGLRVHRCNYDGSEHEVLWKTGDFNDKALVADQTKHCVGIATDDQYFYWTQKGASKSKQGRILRAPKNAKVPADPASRQDVEVLFEHLPEPIDLEIDEENGFLYWTDRGELPDGNSINRVALSDIATGPASEHKHEILVRNMHEAIGLKIDSKHGHMYSTDIGGTVYRFNLDGSDRRKMYDEQGSYTGIAIAY